MSTEPVEGAAPRRRIEEMEVMVADVVSETPDTATLVLFTGNHRLDYQPGHFLTVDPHQFESLERFTAFLEDRYASGSTKYPPLLSTLLVKRTARGAREGSLAALEEIGVPKAHVTRESYG